MYSTVHQCLCVCLGYTVWGFWTQMVSAVILDNLVKKVIMKIYNDVVRG
jgi:hypothetical protein